MQSSSITVSGSGSGDDPWILELGGDIGVGDLSIELLEALCPAGTIRTTPYNLADPGWLLFGQTVTNALTLYPTLWAKPLPTAWKSGSSLILPTDDEMVLRGQSDGTLLGLVTGGNTKTLGSTNLPPHSHTIDHDHGNVTSGGASADHSHGFSAGTTTEIGWHRHAMYGTLGSPGPGAIVDGTVHDSDFGGGVVGYTGGQDSFHTHNVSGTTGGHSVTHTHAVDLPNFAGSSGNGPGTTSAFNVQEAGVNVRFQIKAH